jgi:hypothetical protein
MNEEDCLKYGLNKEEMDAQQERILKNLEETYEVLSMGEIKKGFEFICERIPWIGGGAIIGYDYEDKYFTFQINLFGFLIGLEYHF